MRVFLLDLWMDLREKRLAPVAILLLAGIIAVPIVLASDAQTPAPPPQTTNATTATAAPVIESQSEKGPVESKLQTFSPRDPFEPTERVATTTGGTTGTTGGTTGGGTGTGTTDTGTGGGGGGGGGTTGTQPGTGTGTGKTTGETRTTLYTYTVDLRFGEGGDVKAYNKVRRLDLIPDEDNPKIVFLGVTTTGRTAVFLVDSNIGVDTDGRCRPSRDECSFLYLRPDGDHDQALLTDADGTVYHLRLVDIDRVAVSSADGNTNSGSGNTESNRSPAFTGRANDDEAAAGESAPPGEPEKRSNFQQFFADSAE